MMPDREIHREPPRIVLEEILPDEPPITPPQALPEEPPTRAASARKSDPHKHARAARPAPPDDINPAKASEFLAHWQKSQKDYEDEQEPHHAKRVPQHPAPRFRLARWGMAAGGIAVAGVILFISTAGASVTIAFKPHMDDVALQDIGVAFDTSVAKVLVPQKVIPAEELSFLKKREQSFPTTGKQQIADRARGKAAIINKFSSSPQTLVAGTRFLTDAGILFRLPKSVTVPGAKIDQGKIVPQSVDTDLVADAPGERSNIAGAVTLKIPGLKGTPKYEGFFATVVQGFSGGFQGEATVVSADDLKTGQEQVTKTLFDDLQAEIGRKIPPGFTALKELQNIEITKVTAPAAGTHVEQFSVSAEATGKALVFREEDAVALVKSFALADASDQEFVPGSSQLQYHSRSIDFNKGRAMMTIAGSIKTKTVVHQEELASLVAGKKSGSIADALRVRPEIASFHISIFPSWRASAPSDPAKIHFQPE